MKSNENGIERVIRIILGLIALTLAYIEFNVMAGNLLGIVIAAIGAILLLTGLFGFCPAYRIVGMSTCKKQCCASGECKAD